MNVPAFGVAYCAPRLGGPAEKATRKQRRSSSQPVAGLMTQAAVFSHARNNLKKPRQERACETNVKEPMPHTDACFRAGPRRGTAMPLEVRGLTAEPAKPRLLLVAFLRRRGLDARAVQQFAVMLESQPLIDEIHMLGDIDRAPPDPGQRTGDQDDVHGQMRFKIRLVARKAVP